MTATEELRAMLDERGVEYRFNEYTKVFEWHFDGTDGEGSAHATEVDGGINIIACSLTPEQAIAATLGRGTCRLISAPQYGEGCQECSACGEVLDGNLFDGGRCPHCGAKVVDE